jgi:hypothetical protein
VRTLYPNGSRVEKAEAVVAERPDANYRSRRQQADPFADVPDRGKKVGLEAVKDSPPRQVPSACHVSTTDLMDFWKVRCQES